MGCTNNHEKGSYEDADHEQESEVRKFEQEIGAFRKTLATVLPKICIERDLINSQALERFALKDFSEDFRNFLQAGYFQEQVDGETYYNAHKVKLLLFLLTDDSLIDNGKVSYHMKASFIFNFVKTNENQNLSDPLYKYEKNLKKFLGDLVDVACRGIVENFVKIKQYKGQGLLNQLKDFKEPTVQLMLGNLFQNNGKPTDTNSFFDFNEKFKDNLLFTAGYVREFAWKAIEQKGANKAQEERNKEEAQAEA